MKIDLSKQVKQFRKNALLIGISFVLILSLVFYMMPVQSTYTIASSLFGSTSSTTEKILSFKKGFTQKSKSVQKKETIPTPKGGFFSVKDFALPAYSHSDQLIRHKSFTLVYDETNEQARWVAYKLDFHGKVKAPKAEYIPDPHIRSGSAVSSDYDRSGYDRGHLAPPYDFADRQSYKEAHFMSNISPQKPAFNRIIWKQLEKTVHRWLLLDKTLYIVTGPIFKEKMKKIGKQNDVSVPPAFFKVILDVRKPNYKAIAFIIPNEHIKDKTLKDFVVSVDEVEKRTGLDFFPKLERNKKLQDKLEGEVEMSEWF